MPLEKTKSDNKIRAFIDEIIEDFRLACISRETSLLGRKEVLTGKAKFGIFGDGKELAQIAMAKQFKNGDWRSGYYRDQTFMMAIGHLSVQEFFAGLYAHTDLEIEPHSAGRQMGGHFTTSTINEDGSWKNLMELKNSSADVSPTGSQMPRLLGLAQASKLFRNNKSLHTFSDFSNKGNEVAFGTIGDASTSEGMFWETMNAAGVLQVPMALSVWDDGYGISVPKKFQTIKGSISEALSGFRATKDKPGFEIFNVKGWDYPNLIKTYKEAIEYCRTHHVPVLIHVDEVTQPQGHSTSGSHERYKSKQRLAWEDEFDCIERFKHWISNFNYEGESIATLEELNSIQEEAKNTVKEAQKAAWASFSGELKQELNVAVGHIGVLAENSPNKDHINDIAKELKSTLGPTRRDILNSARRALFTARGVENSAKDQLRNWLETQYEINWDRYSSKLYSEGQGSALEVEESPLELSGEEVDGRIVLRENFKAQFAKNPLVLTFGEDTGKIGGVNQSMEGMQAKFGEDRVMDTGIRECTIIGQGIGLAMRGLRPIAEIQYLDYLLYALQIMSDDLSTIHYRTKGQQIAPLIIRTRGHRLEGIWHSGSPMGAIINAVRGMYVCVPRNMTDAAGMLNTLLQANDPALIVEPLNGYRKKEILPANLGEFTVPLGKVEIVKPGNDITMVSYGSTFNICEEAVQKLEANGISVELIDIKTLLPFDSDHVIKSSLAKTNRLMIVDEDVPGGASSFILDKILVEQEGYYYLDSGPVTLTAKDHRPAYSSDGDYFSKPNLNDIFEKAYQMMSESDPSTFPSIY